ncbi:hypothetical protein Bpfe_027835 [Biomphalaria pfeifferi]|uniref:Uncharacterized protein n=1 Tax=Biomphalaria pfeifferi TaxID=112525 RepID=A0AAD8AVU7_BIOPF|nr:hypothetical protein Bpfe_027835 [Biomphalaria pfeifferi]
MVPLIGSSRRNRHEYIADEQAGPSDWFSASSFEEEFVSRDLSLYDDHLSFLEIVAPTSVSWKAAQVGD